MRNLDFTHIIYDSPHVDEPDVNDLHETPESTSIIYDMDGTDMDDLHDH